MAEGNPAYGRARVHSDELRQTGISAIGDIPWGTHFCQFYEEKQDLIEILVPYIKAGLENNEFCMWVTSKPLPSAQAKAALAARVDNLAKYIENGQLEVLEYSQWYTLGAGFQSDRVLQGWVDRLEAAARRGFDGLRLTGNTSWLEKPDWHGFSEYEATVDAIFGQHRMLGICTYMLSKCSALQIMDVISNHSSALVKRAGKWQVIQSSERKKVEANLHETEERVRMAVASTGLGTWDFDVATGRMICSDLCKRHFGLPPDREVDFNTFLRGIHPDDRERVNKSVQEVLRSGSDGCFDAEYRTIGIEDGKERCIKGMGRAFFDRESRPVCVLGTTLDITERKRADAALRESEERLRLATKATNDAIWDIDLKAGTVSRNDTYSVLYGRPETVDSWQFWIDRIHPEDRARTVDDFQAALGSDASSWSAEYRFRRVDGQWASIYDRAYIARDASGKAWRVIGAMQDLTEQKQAEAALRESEERFRRVFEEGPLGVALMGRDHRFLRVNSALCQMLGYPEEALVQMSFADITHPDDVRVDADLAERLFRREIPSYRLQKRYVKKNGEVIWVNLTKSLILDENGEPLYGLSMVEDITEVKRTQEEALARQKLESLGTLAGGIAHDFNNLLGAVQAQAELALSELDAGSSCKEELNAIREVSMRGSEIVRELMIYAGTESTVVELVDLSKIVDEMLTLLKVSVTKRAVIQTNLDHDLPAIRASAAQLRQIVMNLITNASDAIGDRDGVIRVITRHVTLKGESATTPSTTLSVGRYVQLEVSDTGRGMSVQTQAKVFDPFFTTKSAGRGLGLAVVHGIVRSLGGAIHFTSEPDKGTTFQVSLPCAETMADASRQLMCSDGELAVQSQHGTVLVVEDEDYLREAIVKMLRKSGFGVFETADGTSAIDLLRAGGGKIDVILLDTTIPGAASHEVVAEAANARPNIRVILTSAYSQEMIAGPMSPPQIRSFIRKPFQLGDLLQTLRSSLSS
jgi:PAS domain S-box-containing protein